jgi:hypothetical protein
MKSKIYVIIISALSVLFYISCSNNVPQPLAPAETTVSLPSAGNLAKGGVGHSLTGSANTYNIKYNHPDFGECYVPGPKEKGGLYNVQSFHAIEHGDGQVTGSLISQMQWEKPKDRSDKLEAKVIQLMVDETETKAKIVCEITNDWYGMPLPAWFVEVFVDNGEGASSPRDEMSSWWFSSDPADRDLWLSQTPQEYIDWSWAIIEPFNLPNMAPTVPIDNGNIQVR